MVPEDLFPGNQWILTCLQRVKILVGFAYNKVGQALAPLPGVELATSLLKRNEPVPPGQVHRALAFLDECEVWYILSRNGEATSCRDAVFRRNRLGAQGISLEDELKSGVYVFYKETKRYYAMLHCRANKRLNLDKCEALLQVNRPLARLAAEELERVFGCRYGTVNPFFPLKENCVHIFDQGVNSRKESLPPHTMMTNAGDLTWAIEFDPRELISALERQCPNQVLVADITTRTVAHSRRDIKFGIITGNGPDSGIALWRHVNAYCRELLGDQFRGDLSYPAMTVSSVPEMGLSMELEPRADQVWSHLKQAVTGLCEIGVTHLALACHTTHYFSKQIQEICDRYDTQFISMAQTVIDHIQEHNIRDLTIIGIPYVADLGPWSAYKALADRNIQAVGERAREPLLELGYLVKQLGGDERESVKALNLFNHILKVGCSTQHILIALTEISVLLEHFPKKKRKSGNFHIIDPLELYGKTLAAIHVKTILQPDEVESDDIADEWDDTAARRCL